LIGTKPILVCEKIGVCSTNKKSDIYPNGGFDASFSDF
jgi:hypothetical protein